MAKIGSQSQAGWQVCVLQDKQTRKDCGTTAYACTTVSVYLSKFVGSLLHGENCVCMSRNLLHSI